MIRNVFFNEILTKIYKCSILLLMLLEIRKLFSIESRKVFLDCFISISYVQWFEIMIEISSFINFSIALPYWK